MVGYVFRWISTPLSSPLSVLESPIFNIFNIRELSFALNVGSLGISHHLAHKQKNRSMYMLKFFSVMDKCPNQSHKTHPTDVRDFEGTPPLKGDQSSSVLVSYGEWNVVPLRKAHCRPRKPTGDKTPVIVSHLQAYIGLNANLGAKVS